ncbi:MAG: CHAP domain-containing protein [Ktedonobacteraceae bacterium]|nr:CHAP domain-containing protein [Ktedonobacteraceae bacterium]
MPGLLHQLSPEEHLYFSDRASSPVDTAHLPAHYASPGATRILSETSSLPHVTRQLPDAMITPGITSSLPEYHTGMFTAMQNNTTSLRQPVVIRGTGKKASSPRPKRRHWLMHVVVVSMVALIALLTLMTVLPESVDGARGFNPFKWAGNLFPGSSDTGMSLASQRVATATSIALHHGPLDPGPANNSAPVSGSSSSDTFPWGQCTYWADYRYHQVTGFWVAWNGNADRWTAGALASGWKVSYKPVLHSIIVLQPGVQGAGYVGHVAFVESLVGNNGANTSNFNFYANGGGFGVKSYYTFYAGSGVAFVYHP